jgi:hypothetical protein
LATFSQIKSKFSEWIHERRISDLAVLQNGQLLSLASAQIKSKNLQDYEFRVFSQWGEDGIIQKLIKTVEISNNTFIEFGVENFLESNCRFLMMKDNWSGFVIDGSNKNINQIRQSSFFWKFDIQAKEAFITSANINSLLSESGFDKDLGILSIDIDGVDYWILEAIDHFEPRILILEYNAVFGPERTVTVPNDPSFNRTSKHFSNLYFGASFSALRDLAASKGYTLVGTNSSGGNAFFVRNDLMDQELKDFAVTAKFTNSKFRESRNEKGELTFLRGEERIAAIKGLTVINTQTGVEEPI